MHFKCQFLREKFRSNDLALALKKCKTEKRKNSTATYHVTDKQSCVHLYQHSKQGSLKRKSPSFRSLGSPATLPALCQQNPIQPPEGQGCWVRQGPAPCPHHALVDSALGDETNPRSCCQLTKTCALDRRAPCSSARAP